MEACILLMFLFCIRYTKYLTSNKIFQKMGFVHPFSTLVTDVAWAVISEVFILLVTNYFRKGKRFSESVNGTLGVWQL